MIVISSSAAAHHPHGIRRRPRQPPPFTRHPSRSRSPGDVVEALESDEVQTLEEDHLRHQNAECQHGAPVRVVVPVQLHQRGVRTVEARDYLLDGPRHGRDVQRPDHEHRARRAVHEEVVEQDEQHEAGHGHLQRLRGAGRDGGDHLEEVGHHHEAQERPQVQRAELVPRQRAERVHDDAGGDVAHDGQRVVDQRVHQHGGHRGVQRVRRLELEHQALGDHLRHHRHVGQRPDLQQHEQERQLLRRELLADLQEGDADDEALHHAHHHPHLEVILITHGQRQPPPHQDLRLRGQRNRVQAVLHRPRGEKLAAHIPNIPQHVERGLAPRRDHRAHRRLHLPLLPARALVPTRELIRF
mmetsp:Transcript_17216/g.42368  ORF Transcript_17216/g.42368 Transcript_17216/m.42368 type:complete len:356 (+) Transcript_17216:156-1223(+)